jgi:hypothetical protein
MAEGHNIMASAFSREKTKSKMPQSKKVPRNETYKESLLRRIASGGPSSATVAQSLVASKSSPSTMRLANPSASVAVKEPQEISPANNMSSDLERDAVNNPSTAAKSPKIELKFSKIVSMALIIGPDLKSRVTTSSSIKDTAVKISKVSDKKRGDESTINFEATKKARTDTDILSAYFSSESIEKRMRSRMAGIGFPNVPRKATPLPIPEKEALKSESKALNSWKATNSSNSLRDRFVSKSTKQTNLSNATGNSDIEDVSQKNTPPRISNVNDKKRKNEATTPSKNAKKARKTEPANDTDKSPFKLDSNKRSTLKKPDLDNPIDLITPTRCKSSPVLLSIPMKKHRKPRPSKLSPISLNIPKESDPNNTVDLTTPTRSKSSPVLLSVPKKKPRIPKAIFS